ncbi:hypothetical protein B5807_07181 [Epicoccum nigrum]|uniref:Prion-inhibition and propagation HeLo domain-containing protein n=1 Tax=Epicoccum nigrum TaxID=105696 RepID=A0A1Y2LUG2_EPING|nr:hypothetical protein B5807_07181 [Epicoccum nigrum]
MAELAGLALAITPIVFKAVADGLKILDEMVHFDEETEDMLIRTETAKAHLSIWAAGVGIAEGELVPALHPLNGLIVRTLQRIEALITNIQQHGNQYGLESANTESKRAVDMVVQMRRSLHSVLRGSNREGNLGALIQAAEQLADRKQKSVARRLRWAIRDKAKSEHFVETLEKHVNGLQKLIFENQRREVQHAGTRYDFQIVQEISDSKRLSLLQNALPDGDSFSEMDLAYLAQCKAISLQKAESWPRAQSQVGGWSICDASPADLAKTRFLRPGVGDSEVAYLFEKKDYDPNISEEDKDLLHERIRNLVSLLGKTGSKQYLQTLQAVGYTDDPDRHCWWIVFRFPLGPLDTLEAMGNEPLSLRKLFHSPFKPALETRYKLAKRIVYTFARLYGSDWMHKSINSSNIIFPQVYSTKSLVWFQQIETALVQGFGYSRQHTEAQTLDRGKSLHHLEAAIYRHPLYQGEAASGYKVHYDIYSLGTVLFEIAIWSPLMALLAAKYRLEKAPPVTLSPNMRQFYEPEARELHRRVNLRTKEEVAYRMGTKYKSAVQWCLNLEGPVTAIDFYNTVAIPLDDLCSCSGQQV